MAKAKKTKKASTLGKPYWFIHHAEIIEVTSNPIADRIRHIKQEKPEDERAIRLKVMKPVKRVDLLPKPVREAIRRVAKAVVAETAAVRALRAAAAGDSASYLKASDTYSDAWQAAMTARDILRGLVLKHMDALQARHQAEYPQHRRHVSYESEKAQLIFQPEGANAMTP